MSRKAGTSGVRKPDFNKLRLNARSYDKLFKDAMYYVHYEISSKQLKDEAVLYAKYKGLRLKNLATLENYWFSSVGKPCFISNKGGEIDDRWREHVDSELKRLDEVSMERMEEETPSAPTPRDNRKVMEVADAIDQLVDSFMSGRTNIANADPTVIMEDYGLNEDALIEVRDLYQGEIQELEQLLLGEDTDLKEGYPNMTKKDITTLYSFYKKIHEYAKDRRINKDKGDLYKVVSRLKYCKNFKELKMSSITPINIIGSRILWVYNTKTRKLIKYVSIDDIGLDVNGSNITLFSEENSKERSVRPHYEELKGAKSADKIRKVYDKCSTIEITPNGRITDAHILLFTDKTNK